MIFNSQNGGKYLIKIDKNGAVIRIQDKFLFHHSIHKDSKGLIYACITNKQNRDQGFAILDKDLKIISVNYIHDIYEEYGLESRLYSSNSNDPVHINDVEPLLKDKGEASDILFINLRSTSSQIIYDIKNKKIISIFDTFTSQPHDVDIVSSEPLILSVFDNNIKRSRAKTEGNKIVFFENIPSLKKINMNSNQISIYFPSSSHFIDSKINIKKIDFSDLDYNLIPQTIIAGLSEYNNKTETIIIEEGNYGRIFEYDPKTNKILWTFLNANEDKSNYWRMNWSRFYSVNPLEKKK